MASSLIANAIQINFDSVLGILDNDGMVNMFKALEASGLRGFLGCPSILYERELEQFFDTAIVQEGDITCAVSGKYVAISESRFSEVFGLPTEGLTDISAVPEDLVYDARSIFSQSGEPVSFLVGSFDVVTHERFLMMTAIHFGIKVNWRKILFEVLKEMVDKTIKRSKGFAVQICVLLKSDPAVTLGDATTFPQLKILYAKTVSTYVATNKTIDSRGETVEPGVAKVAIVRKKSVSKKKSTPTVLE
ncbi:protein transport protein sec31-like [Dorcoceras hygrometricum]|uniref:Protein transport protein sec31-like n=1 Tax=Dorcoceras hygrometricum TaxID=472368 RepID=A0A2Z7DFP1_9LAMI|nr:protein transport protein sec31-like [Dorcoceras hygrometricum]